MLETNPLVYLPLNISTGDFTSHSSWDHNEVSELWSDFRSFLIKSCYHGDSGDLESFSRSLALIQSIFQVFFI